MKNVPNLRFKEFSGEWNLTNLRQVTTSFEYGMNVAATEFDGENKYIRITDIDENTSKYLNDNVVSPSGELEDKYLVKQNDILFARTGASTGKTYLYNNKDGRLYFAGFLIRANINSDNNSKFIFLQTKTRAYNNWVQIMSMRSGQPGINAQEYSSYSFYAPAKQEQEKIASFFSLIDKKIELQTEKVEELKNYKKGIMQKIFSQELRFKDENGNEYPEWEEVNLCNILEEVSEKTGVINQYEVISSTNSGLYIPKDYFNREIASKDNIGYKILKRNQVVISPQNLWMGNINLNSKYDIGMVSPSYKIFDIKSEFDSSYIGFVLRTERAFYEYKQASEQGASIVRRNLNMDLFYDIRFKLPCKAEQYKISKFINKIDCKIEQEMEKLNSLNQYKKGLLQQMFI